MTRSITSIVLLFVVHLGFSQNIRIREELNNDSITMLNLNMEITPGNNSFQAITTDFRPQSNIVDLLIAEIDLNGNQYGMIRVSGDDYDIYAKESCQSWNDDHIVLVGAIEFDHSGYNHFAFFMEYNTTTQSVSNFVLYEDIQKNFEITLLDVEIGFDQEYVVVGSAELRTGNGGFISLIWGLDIIGGVIWYHDYTVINGAKSAFENVERLDVCPDPGGTGSIQGECFLVSGIGDNLSNEFLSSLGVFNYVNQGFDWVHTIQMLPNRQERTTHALYDEISERILVYSQNELIHNFVQYRFDIHGNYIDGHYYQPVGLTFPPGQIVTSVEFGLDNSVWMNGYYNCGPITATACPSGVEYGDAFTYITDNTGGSMVNSFYFPVDSVWPPFILNGTPDLAIGIYHSGPDLWTPQSQYYFEDVMYSLFGEQRTSTEAINFVGISDPGNLQMDSACGVEIDIEAIDLPVVPVFDERVYEAEFIDPNEVKAPTYLITTEEMETIDCENGQRFGVFPEISEDSRELMKIDLYDQLGRFLASYKSYSSIPGSLRNGLLIVKETYDDGSVEVRKIIVNGLD